MVDITFAINPHVERKYVVYLFQWILVLGKSHRFDKRCFIMDHFDIGVGVVAAVRD